MSWNTLIEADVQTRLTGAELNAVKTAALANGQPNPLTDTIAQVVQAVRGRVAACQHNRLGAGATIPDELHAAALDMIAYRLLSRLPVASLVTSQREKGNSDALSLLRDVARCEFRIEQPATATSQIIAGPAIQQVSGNDRRVTRNTMKGL